MSAVILAHNRARAVGIVLDRLAGQPIDEILVVDNGSVDGTAEAVRARNDERTRVVDAGGNVGLEGRNLGAREAQGRYVLFLDDDSYPLPGAVEVLVELMEQHPEVGIVGGFVEDVGFDGVPRPQPDGINTFDWFLRAARRDPVPAEGFPAFFFPEGASLVRRDVYLAVGGYPKEFFFSSGEIDVATRVLAAGSDVRYLPTAVFHHMKDPTARMGSTNDLHFRVRNHLWYLFLRLPADVAVRQAIGYTAFDLVQAVHQHSVRSWMRGIVDAVRQRGQVRGQRAPIPRSLVKRAGERRARAHVLYLVEKLRRRMHRQR